MMMNKPLTARLSVAVAGGALLAGVAGAAIAAPIDDDDVTVTVEVTSQEPVGELMLAVASDSTSLTEGASEADGTRVFNGVLPTVSVSDDREDVPAENYWYVTGQATELTTPDGGTIGADKLGWVPALLSGDEALVAAGDEVVTSLDDPTIGSGQTANNVGLVGNELLAIAPNMEGELTTGAWTANAALQLKTPADQAPGAYSGTITLTLWEDAI